MDPSSVTVAVVRSDNRRGAVAQTLALIADDLCAVVTPQILIKPNLVSHKYQLPSTHRDTLSATLDALLNAGAVQAVVAEGASDATAGFARFGYQRETWGRPVRYLDLNRDEDQWDHLELTAADGSSNTARLSRTIASADCRVSLALAKTHVTAMVTLSLKNMLSSIHPSDRVMMHGHRGGNGYTGWKRLAVEFLKGDNRLVNVLTRTMGRARNLRAAWNGADAPDAWRRFSAAEQGFVRSVAVMNQNLVALSRRVHPHVSVVDGFVGMHREGPKHGTSIRLGTVVAGTDPVAVDAVAAALMGFDPKRIGYLVGAEAAGLGVADLDRIRIVGDPITAVRKHFVPHSNYRLQRHWNQSVESRRSGPHVRPRSPEPEAASR